ncbi:helix-turn-helix domain-containing protein [Sphingomonas sp. Leaf257]|uniref:helix-turn-helix domain-containing protein n=1 Tax=Sphingomonas sp. Leaf257 TaxID=1736309 RepID=UPI0006F41AAF|nr:helix-turn-helix domain-containing protein [Sphingomonas sp. Leaf257]KQO51431.1 hypothetical protein ASF14_08005 [Sphingomonas sp. Leaf257]
MTTLGADAGPRVGRGAGQHRCSTWPLSRAAMAEAPGLVVETVSRHMTAFQQDGLITFAGLRGVHLLDRVRLAGIAS